MPKVYFKISHSYFTENLKYMIRSCIDTGTTHITFYRTLVQNTGGRIEGPINRDRPIEVRVIIINSSDQHMNAYFTFRIEEHEKRYKELRHKRITAKILYDGGAMVTFETDLTDQVFNVIAAMKPQP